MLVVCLPTMSRTSCCLDSILAYIHSLLLVHWNSILLFFYLSIVQLFGILLLLLLDCHLLLRSISHIWLTSIDLFHSVLTQYFWLFSHTLYLNQYLKKKNHKVFYLYIITISFHLPFQIVHFLAIWKSKGLYGWGRHSSRGGQLFAR